MPDLEIVSHCWAGQLPQYADLLAYQLSSIRNHAPAGRTVVISVCCCPVLDHRTAAVLHHFASMPPGVVLRPWPMSRERLMRRAIGRNELALQSQAAAVWFAGCDYHAGEGALEAMILAATAPAAPALMFPVQLNRHKTHEQGDAAISRAAAEPSRILTIDPSEFESYRPGKAIGCLQIVPGDVARRGYLPDTRWQSPEPRWAQTHEDVAYRKWLGVGRGTPIAVPNLYRLRHTKAGRDDTGEAA